MKHTPGPWTVENDWTGEVEGDRGYRISDIAIGTNIIRIRQHVLGKSYPELIANARLIAAAPELLEACRGLLAIADRYTGVGLREIAMARAAVEAAGGE